MTRESYSGTYGDQPCTLYPENRRGQYRYFTVALNKDPGYGSMWFYHIHRSQIKFEIEPPPERL